MMAFCPTFHSEVPHAEAMSRGSPFTGMLAEVPLRQQFQALLSRASLIVKDALMELRRGSRRPASNTIPFCSARPSDVSSNTSATAGVMRLLTALTTPVVGILAAGTYTGRPPSIVKNGCATRFRLKI